MPKVNPQNLDGSIQEIIIKQFIYSLVILESPKQTAAFFSNFLSDGETIMLSKRLAIAVLLLRGHSQTLITKILSVSYSATGAVSSWLKNAEPATMLVLNTLSQNDDWKELVYNYKTVNQPKKAGRQTKPINTAPTASIPPGPNAPSDLPPAIQAGDFEGLDGPQLTSEQDDPSSQIPTAPSMNDMLENI